MSVDARNIMMTLLGWFQQAYFLVIITSSITPYVILSPASLTLPPCPSLSHITLPAPRLSLPHPRAQPEKKTAKRTHFLFYFSLFF